VWGSGSVGLRFDMQTRPPLFSLACGSCSSSRDFALGFLQIPPHGGHPCHQLVVPTAKPTADFHRQVNAHAGRTYKSRHYKSGGFIHTFHTFHTFHTTDSLKLPASIL